MLQKKKIAPLRRWRRRRRRKLHRKFTSLKWILCCWVHEMFPGSTMASMIHPCLPFPTLVRFPSLILSCHCVSWVNCGQHKEEKNKGCEWGPHHLLNHFCLFWVVVAFNFLSCGTSSGGRWGEKKKGEWG